MGARTNAVDSALASTLGLDRARGAIISEVYPGGPADKAGLEERDVVLALAGTDINDGSGLRFKLATLKRDERADIKIWRDGRERNFKIRAEVPQESPARDETFLDGVHPLDGATVVNMSPALGEEIGVDPYVQGVLVLTVARRSAAQYNALRPGDFVTQLNGQDILSARDLETKLTRGEAADGWSMSIDRGGRIYDVPIRYLPKGN
jgi:S1-C subfamily serine protease